MSLRLADPWWFHAEGSLVSWSVVARQAAAAGTPGAEELVRRAAEAGNQVQLRWAVADGQGLPPGPFTVWSRPVHTKPTQLPHASWSTTMSGIFGQEVSWGFASMASVTVDVSVDDPTHAVLVLGFMSGPALETLVAVASQAAGSATASLTVRAGAILSVLVVNGAVTNVSGEPLADAVNDPAWKELELVGLPLAAGDWPAGGYDLAKQGLVSALTDPVQAAVERLQRGSPPFGWWPATQGGHPAPAWAAPDPAAFVAEVRGGLLGELAVLFAPGVAPQAQAPISVSVGGMVAPTQDGRTVPATTSSTHYPFATLQLGTTTDPFAALGLGFGTAYPYAQQAGALLELPRQDFLVTADYPQGISGDGTSETRAAFVPVPLGHAATAPVNDLAATLAGLVGPATRDGEWRESVRLSWGRVEPTAALGRPSGHGFCRFPQGPGSPAESLLEKRDCGGWRSVAPTPRPVPGSPGAYQDHIDWSTQAEPIPLGSGGRHVGYAVAVQDLYGVWSPWRDVAWDSGEPQPPTPQVVSARLDTAYAGSTMCASTLELHLAVDWTNRTPSSVTLLGVLAALPASNTPLPAGTTALGAPPAGAVRHDVTFAVGAPGPAEGLVVPAGTTVDYLDASAQNVVAGPGDALQGAETRHYRLRLPLDLDFAASDHYALALWAQEVDGVGTGSPGSSPVVARVSTPVPVIVSFSPLPVVPLGSAPDAASLSHGRIAWAAFTGARNVTIWACPETAVRNAAGLGPIVAGDLLSVRFVELLAAYDGLDAARQRSIFRRETQVDGAATEVQVTLPPGSDEITLYAVTATNQGNVESAWPTVSDQLRAYARPRLVAPSTPEVVAVGDGSSTATVTVTVGGTVEPVRVQLFRTMVDSAATSIDRMGPAVDESTSFVLGPDGRWSATMPDTPGPTWRTIWYRAVAWAHDVPTDGVVGVRSAGSVPFPLVVAPTTAPDLSVPAVTFWGTDRDGVLATWTTDAPPQAGRLGPSTVRVRVTRDAAAPGDPPAIDRESRLDALAVDPGASPPLDVTGGVLQRSLRNAGRTPMYLWLRRSDPSDLLTLVVTVTDPLGRSTTVTAPVPAVPPDLPPDVTLGTPQTLAGGVAVPFASHVPLTPVLDGVYVIDVYAAHPLVLPPHPFPLAAPVSPLVAPVVGLHAVPVLEQPVEFTPLLPPHWPPASPLHLRVAVPDVPVIVSAADIPPGTKIGVFRSATATHPPQYVVVAALTSPVAVRVVVSAPNGTTAQATVTA
jgi:hypothetical protein